jgi:hypothetical protein
MRNLTTTLMLVGALTGVPVAGFSAQAAKAPAQSAAKPSPKAAKATVASHATTGVVKSVDTTTLVISRTGKKPGDMTFALNPSTHREGTIEAGASVSVRYREEGKTNVATAITAQRPKQQATRASTYRK